MGSAYSCMPSGRGGSEFAGESVALRSDSGGGAQSTSHSTAHSASLAAERDGVLLGNASRGGVPAGFVDASALLREVPSPFRARVQGLFARPGSEGFFELERALTEIGRGMLTAQFIREAMIEGSHAALLPSLGVLLRHGVVDFSGATESLPQARWNPLPHKHASVLHVMAVSNGPGAQTTLAERLGLLAGAGVNLDVTAAEGETPLMWAVRQGAQDSVQAFLAAGVDAQRVNAYGLSALHLAAVEGHGALVPLLVGAGVDANFPVQTGRRAGWTALHLAAVHGGQVQCDAIRMLGLCGAGLNLRTPKGESALWLATVNGKADAVRALAGAGAAVDLRHGKEGFTALHQACAVGAKAVGLALLESGANPQAATRDGSRPLHLVGRRLPGMPGHRRDLAAALLAAGANIDQPDRRGCLPLEAAGRAGNDFVYGFLLSREAAGERRFHMPAIYP